MNIDKAVLALMGIMILASLALGYWVSQYWFLLTAFVGVNALQASVTGFCLPAILFRKLGMKAGCAFKGNENSEG